METEGGGQRCGNGGMVHREGSLELGHIDELSSPGWRGGGYPRQRVAHRKMDGGIQECSRGWQTVRWYERGRVRAQVPGWLANNADSCLLSISPVLVQTLDRIMSLILAPTTVTTKEVGPGVSPCDREVE